MHSGRALAVAAITAGVAVVVGGVSGCAEPTQLVVHVWTDMLVPTEVDQVRVRVSHVGEATPTYDNTLPLAASGEMDFRTLLSFGAGPRDDDTSRRVQVEVDAMRGGGRLFTTVVRTGFARHKRLRLDVYLARRCLVQAATCLPDETCGLDGCVSPDVPVERLPPADMPPPSTPTDPRSPDGGMDGGSADAGALEAGTDAATDASASDAAPSMVAVRQLAPLSTSRVWSSSPTLRWERPAGATVAFELYEGAAMRSSGTVTGDATMSSSLTPGVYRWRVQLLGSGVWSPWWLFVVPPAVSERDISAGTVPDVNGDGMGDLVVSQTTAGNAELVANLATGGGGFASPATTALTDPAETTRIVVSAGDVDGDGFADIAVGAPTAGAGVGAVDVFRGSAAGLAGMPTTTSGSGASQLGAAIAAVGDTNGDGYGDVAIGAPGSAQVLVLLGSASGPGVPMPLTSFCPPPDFGAAVAGVDLDGDGRGDVVVGAPAGLGAGGIVYAYLAPFDVAAPTLLNDPLAGADGPGFGATLASLGDIDLDGLGDFVIGHPDAPPGGHVWVVPGASLGTPTDWLRIDVASSTRGGAALAGPGDLSGDGRGDVGLGAPDAFGATGRAIVYMGSSAAELMNLSGGGVGSQLGAAVAFLGDASGDGHDDFAVGVPGTGTVGIVFGPFVATAPLTYIAGPPRFGASIAGAQ